MCLGATAIAVSVIITAAELLAGGERANRKGLRGWSWYCMTKMVQVRLAVGLLRNLAFGMSSVRGCGATRALCLCFGLEGSAPTAKVSGVGAGTA